MSVERARCGASTLSRQGRLLSFETLRRAGLSRTSLARCERYRRKRERVGTYVAMLAWPDGTRCLLALHTTLPGVAVLSDGMKADAYEDAFGLIEDGFLPLLALRNG